MPMSLRRVITTGAFTLTVVFVAAAGFSWRKLDEIALHSSRMEGALAIKTRIASARRDLTHAGLMSNEPPTDESAREAQEAALHRLNHLIEDQRQRVDLSPEHRILIERLSKTITKGNPNVGPEADRLLEEYLAETHRRIESAKEHSKAASLSATVAALAAAVLSVGFLLWLSFAYQHRQRRETAALVKGLERLRHNDFEHRLAQDESGFSPLVPAFNNTVEHLDRTRVEAQLPDRAAHTDGMASKIVDVALRAILLVDKDGKITMANASAEQMFQRKREELTQLKISELLPESLLAAAKTHGTHTLARNYNKRSLSEWATFTRPDGSQLHVDFDIVLTEHDGELHSYAVISDITQRVKEYLELKKELAETQEALDRHRMITEAAELGCFLNDLRDNSHHADDRYLEMIGETRESFPPIGDSFYSRVHPEDLRRINGRTQDQREGRTKRVESEFRLRHRDGRWIWVFAVANTIVDAEGNVIAIAGFHRDITEEMATRNELENQRRLLSSLSGNIPGVLHRLVAHPDGRRNFRYVGENSEAVLGVPAVQFDLDTLTERMEPDCIKEFLEGIEYSIREGFNINREFRVRRGDGEWRWIRMVSHVVASTPGGGTWDGIFTDVSEQVTQRLDLEAARKEADKANRAKSIFLASMSHELRTPLSGMLAVTGMLQETRLDPDQRELLGMQLEAGETLMAVLTDVLDLSKIESGKFDLEPEVIDIEKMVRRTMDVVRTQATTKGLELRMSISSDITQYAIGDAVRLRQVLLNLLNNAVKFTTAGSIDIHVDEAGGDSEHHMFRFAVVDTGIGIAPEAAKNLFEPFRQLGEADARVGGTGLGLAICRKFIELMEGRIGFESNPGEGSRFWFIVPLRRVQGVGAGAVTRWQGTIAPDDSVEPPTRVRSLRVLVADDIKLNQTVTQRALERAGHRVTLVSNGEQVIDALGCGEFDAIIMDARMPVLDGVEATRRIRASGGSSAKIPIIGLTADVLPERLQECIDAGMNNVLTKPFDRLVLVSYLESLTGSSPDVFGDHHFPRKPDSGDSRRSAGA